jgi:hypothetical protein
MGSSSMVMQEYLVKLGFIEDSVGYARFVSVLRGVGSIVDNEVFQMGKRFVAFQVGAVGAFAAIGAAALGIADKTAMADQEYRLLALHMYTSLPVARELKIALDALGQPLENIMWDPELARRFNQLVKDQRELTEQLGPDFENQMLKIRDVRFEWTRFTVELEYLTMNVVRNLAQVFGTNIDDVLQRMRTFNAWFIANMPAIAGSVANNLKPVLQDVATVMKSLWDFTKQAVIEFTNLIALISGDDSLKTTTADFEKLAIAVRKMVDGVALAVAAIFQLGTNIMLLLDAGVRAAGGDTKGALKDLHDMKPLTEGAGSEIIDRATQQELQKRFISDWNKSMFGPVAGSPGADAKSAVIAMANRLGVPPELALAVAQTESNFKQFGPDGKVLTSTAPGSHAMGMFQLQPGTAKMLGVNAADQNENIYGGVKYLRKLLTQYHGNTRMALEHYYGSKDAGANAAYASKVMHVQSTYHVSITVQGSNASKDQIKGAVIDGIREADRQKTQRNIGEFQIPAWSY